MSTVGRRDQGTSQLPTIIGETKIDSISQTTSPEEGALESRVSSAANKTFPRFDFEKRNMEAFFRSRIVRAVVISASAALLAAFLLSNPIGWAASAAGTSVLAMKIILSISTGGVFLLSYGLSNKAGLAFEASAMNRLREKSVNTEKIPLTNIQFYDKHGREIDSRAFGELFLSSLPNAATKKSRESFLQHLPKDESKVLSVNEKWEVEQARGFSIPFSKSDYERLGVGYHPLTAKDHKALTVGEMDEAADEIYEALTQGKNVLVHCRAGVGRSSTAIAAFLLKYTNLSIAQTAVLIKGSRPKATIWNKLHALVDYFEHLQQKGFRKADEVISEKTRECADTLRKQKKPKLPKKDIRELEVIAELQRSPRSMTGEDVENLVDRLVETIATAT